MTAQNLSIEQSIPGNTATMQIAYASGRTRVITYSDPAVALEAAASLANGAVIEHTLGYGAVRFVSPQQVEDVTVTWDGQGG